MDSIMTNGAHGVKTQLNCSKLCILDPPPKKKNHWNLFEDPYLVLYLRYDEISSVLT